MAHAKLHIICGNCGSNQLLSYKIKVEKGDKDIPNRQVVYIFCNNCNTLHDLDDNAKQESTNPIIK